MEFVDEEDRVFRTTHFIHHGFDAFFELTTILRTGHHHGQVKHHNPFITKSFRHIAFDDQLSHAFDDGGFANAGFAQKDGIIFRSTRENLDHTFDLVGPANDRIKFDLTCQLCEIATEAIQCGCLAFGALGAGAFAASAATAPTLARAGFHAVA